MHVFNDQHDEGCHGDDVRTEDVVGDVVRQEDINGTPDDEISHDYADRHVLGHVLRRQLVARQEMGCSEHGD